MTNPKNSKCVKCGVKKTPHNTTVKNQRTLSLHSYCKKCRADAKVKVGKPRGLSRLESRYGITADQYDVLVKKQKGQCAICKQPCTVNTKLSVDHNHTTGKVRGLLCHRCNLALGLFKDDVNRLQAALNYLLRDNKIK